MYLIYDFALFLYALIYLPYLILTKRGYPGFEMRLGFFPLHLKNKVQAKDNIWVHAVSVGEVMAVDGLIDQLRKTYPNRQIVATVTTKTGYALACDRLKEKAVVLPSPIDFSFVVKGFIALIEPKMYIAVETEIWPNLYKELHFKKIPIAIVNGRISDNSYGRYQKVRSLLTKTLNQVQAWCMQSQKDAGRIIELGAPSSRVFMTGNIKFDESSEPSDPSLASFAANKNELWWVAGSTHPGEEEIVLDVYGKVFKDNPNWRLLIAPRHIERAPQVKELVKRLGFNDVVVLDTIGQLRSLYAKASLVFVGKSLCVGGGHNVIEPAAYGKAIVIGPMVENFRDIVACFKEKNAIVQVEDASGFEHAVRALCADASKRDTLGAAAREVVTSNQGATQRTLEHLTEFLK